MVVAIHAQNPASPQPPPNPFLENGVPIFMVETMLQTRFDRVDANRDGELSEEEIKQVEDRRKNPGNVEVRSRPRSAANQDGRQQRAQGDVDARPRRAARGSPRSANRPRLPLSTLMDMSSLSSLDTNDNGTVSQAEFKELIEKMKKLDANNDGNLDAEEMAVASAEDSTAEQQ